jgi:Predicted hydrolases or acyltransferases (alpha/beta hydrolase superfamily)
MSLPRPPAEYLSDFSGHNFVLIHGLGMAPVFWRLYAPQYVLEHKSVAYPLPGHDSWPLPLPGQTINTRDVVMAYAEAIEQDFDGQPVTLVGHSTGGFVSLALAAHRPDLVRSVVLLGGFACGRFEGRERLAARLLRVPGFGPALFRTLFRRWISTQETFRLGSLDCVYDKTCPWETAETLQLIEDVRTRLQRCRAEDVGAVVYWLQRSNLLDHIRGLTVPVLNLVGADDEVVPAYHQLRLSRCLPNAMTVLFNKTGHLLMVERQSDLNRIFSHFCIDPAIVITRSRPAARTSPRPGAPPKRSVIDICSGAFTRQNLQQTEQNRGTLIS